MAESLSESTWTAYTKKAKLDLDDAALVKALARYDKTPESKAQARLEALGTVCDEIRKQVVALGRRKKELGDKPFGETKDKLHALLDSAESLQKELQKSADAAAAQGDAGGEDEESPALLTTRLVPLLREVRKGELVLQALVAVAGKETVVLLQRKPISPARGKLLKEQMTNPGGLKFIRGDCRWEANALTFVVQAPAAGLAKKIKQALLDQTNLRQKVRVRGDDGQDDFEDDAEGAAEAAAGDAAAAAGEVPPAPPQPATQPGAVEPAAAFTARLTALLAAIKGAPPEVRAKAAEAGQAAKKRAFDDANALLDEVERMLEGPRGDAGGGDAGGGETLEQTLARWKAQRAQAIATLKGVATRIASAKHAQSARAILEIQAVIKNITAEPATLQQVTELQTYLGSDDVVNDVCELAEDIRTPLLGVLTELRAQVA